MDVAHLFTASLDLLGLLGFAGGAVAYYRKGRGDSIIAYASNEISLRDDTIARQKQELAALTAERDVLKRQNADLVNLVQGSPQLEKVAEQIRALALQVADVAKRGEGA